MVLVAEDRDRCPLLQVVGDGKAVRCPDMVEADGSESWGQCQGSLDDRQRVMQVNADRHGVDAGEGFEEDALRLEERQRGFDRSASGAEEVGGVGEQGDRVAARGEVERGDLVLADDPAGLGDARGIDQAEHGAVAQRDLAGDPDQPPVAAAERQGRIWLVKQVHALSP
ncbi:hypothetical protein HRbin26_01366 [bacterium HR26]|nr:hypothetical protein HRbin26_01366 [bacterium HR26]